MCDVMKKINLMMIVCLICSSVMLGACAGNDDIAAGNDEQVADCTIIFYGVGGATLDLDVYNNLRQMYRGLVDHSNVEGVVFFKNSSYINSDMRNTLKAQNFEFHKATAYRFCVDRTMADNAQMQFADDNIYGGDGANINIAMADTLAHFISYAATMRPARRYVLVLSDHGRGYNPMDDRAETLLATSRGILTDDGYTNTCMSARGIRTAIERSGVAIDAVYLDACLMNCVETLYELSEVTKHIVSATYYTPDVGGEYTHLVDRLATSTDCGQALARYCDDVADYWKQCEEAGINPGDYFASDINVISCEQLRTAAPALRSFIDQLTQDYTDPALASQIDAVTAHAKANESESALYDLCAYFDSLMVGVSSTALVDAAREAKTRMLQCKLNSRGTVETEHNGLPSFNFLLGADGSWLNRYDYGGLLEVKQYRWDGTMTVTYYNGDTMVNQNDSTWGRTGDETYAKLIFEKLTGWSRWLKLNKQQPK